MQAITDVFTQAIALIRNPGPLIEMGGYPALGLIIFAETGALVFFLPGDSLLIIAGFYAAKGDLSILALNALLGPLAVLGDACSYAIGKHLGPRLLQGSGGRLLRPDHLRAAERFYARHGGKAIIMARFVPVVRTFIPVVAGIAKMPYRRFAAFNVVGGLGWIGSMTLIGYFLGARFPMLRLHLEKVIVGVLILSVLPGLFEYLKARRSPRQPS
jgi:membrane-associated protein